MRKKMMATLICLLMAAVICSGCNKPAKKPMLAKRIVVTGFAMNSKGPDDSFPSIQKHADVINVISPLWYHVNDDGSIASEARSDVIAFAKKNGVKIIPLINLVHSQDEILVSSTASANAIKNIVQIVKQNNYDGVNIDFEFIPSAGKKDFSVDRGSMTNFMKLLHDQLKPMGKKTNMSVLPHVEVAKSMTGVYDYGALVPYVDQVTLMCYDHAQEGSVAGELSPFGWVESNIQYALKQGFKPAQVCLGVATYGYDWPVGQPGGFSRPTKDIMSSAKMKDYKISWSDKYQEPYYSYYAPDGQTRIVWFENYQSLKNKIALVKKYDLNGICIWRLGFEDKAFWKVINDEIGKK